MNADERKTLRLITASHTRVHLIEGAVPPLFPLLLGVFGANYFQLGLVMTVFSYAFGLGSLPAGILADKFGPKRLLVAYLFGAGILCLSVVPVNSLLPFGIILGLLGLLGSLYHPAANTMIIMEMKEQGKALGINGIAGSLGTAAVPVLAAWLGTRLGWKSPHVIFGSLTLLVGVFATRLPSPERKAGKTAEENVGSRVYVPVLVAFFASCAIMGMSSRGTLTFLPTYLGQKVNLGIPVDAVTLGGVFATLTLVFGAAGQYVAGRLVDRHRPDVLYAVTLFVAAATLVVMTVSDGMVLIAASVVNAFFTFAYQPLQNMLISRVLPKNRLGVGYGFLFFMSCGGGSAAAAFSGWLADGYGLRAVFLAATVNASLAFTCVLAVIRMRNRETSVR